MSRIGIDFGTTNSAMVAYDKNKHEFTYFNFSGSEPKPISSTVWYHDNSIKVGHEARSKIYNFVNIPGHHFERSIKLKLEQDIPLNILGDEVESYKVASKIISYIKQIAIDEWDAQNSGADLNQAVFTVPINFSGKSRRRLRQAANEAGIETTCFIHEPFAAIIGYYFNREYNQRSVFEELNKLKDSCLVFDWGGGTLDVTVVKVENKKMIEVGTSELTGLAGDKIDEYIATWAWNKFLDKYGSKYNSDYLEILRKQNWSRLLAIAESCKIKLSTEEKTEFYCEGIVPEKHYEVIDEEITREILGELIYQILISAGNCIDKALRSAGILDIDISKVLLTGGTSYIPAVQKMMSEKFGHRVLPIENSDMLIAQGAAVISEMGWLPFLAKDIQVELSDGSLWAIFEKNMPIANGDAKKQETFICVDQRNKYAKIIISEGVGQKKDKNLAILNIPTLSDRKWGDDIVISMVIDKDIVLTIEAWSKMSMGYNQPDEEYSIRKTAQVNQMCFGLNFGGADNELPD